MTANLLTFAVGIICIILGIMNMRGNISSLHYYHRKRVSEEDRLPFGRKVGLGTVIIGTAVIIFSVLSIIALYTDLHILTLIGSVIMIIGLIVGLGISFYAMIKYNKGIF